MTERPRRHSLQPTSQPQRPSQRQTPTRANAEAEPDDLLPAPTLPNAPTRRSRPTQPAVAPEDKTQQNPRGTPTRVSRPASQTSNRVSATRVHDSLNPTDSGAVEAERSALSLSGQITGDAGLAKYELGAELGRGGIGKVQLAYDRQLRRELAIKRLLRGDNPTIVAQFIEEAQITGQLDHPNIVPVHELGIDEQGRPWLAMKRVRGKTLREYIRRWTDQVPVLTPAVIREMLRIFDKVCDAVRFAHDRGVIHRDIKPDNIMIGEYGEVLVMDWGIAKPIGGEERVSAQALSETPTGTERDTLASPVGTDRRDSTPAEQLTMQGAVLGTPAYMAPEQAHGALDEIGPRSDIFALGAVLYHMLTGALVYSAKDVMQVVMLAAQAKYVRPRQKAPGRGIPAELEAIVLKAMAKRADRRYATVRQLQEDLAAFLAYQPTTAYRASWLERVSKFVRRHPTATLGTTFGVVMVALATTGIAATWALAADRDLQAEVAAKTQRQLENERLMKAAADAKAEHEAAAREAADAKAANALLAKQAAEAQALAKQGEVDKLMLLWGGQKARIEKEEAVQEFTAKYQQAFQPNASLVRNVLRTFEQISDAEVNDYIRAFEDLFKARAQFGPRVSVAEVDYLYAALLCEYGRDEPAKAAEYYTRCFDYNPQNIVVKYFRGVAYLKAGDYPRALADFEFNHRINPLLFNADVLAMVRVAAERGADAAIQYCRDFVTRNPRHVATPLGWGMLGVLLRNQGKLEQANQAFDKGDELSDPGGKDSIALLRWRKRS